MDNNSFVLCAKLLQHAFYAKHTEGKRSSELKEALKFFFTEEEINAAIATVTGCTTQEEI